jgi:hypothetical protein
MSARDKDEQTKREADQKPQEPPKPEPEKAEEQDSAIKKETDRLLRAIQEQKETQSTRQLTKQSRIHVAVGLAFGLPIGDTSIYIPLPAELAEKVASKEVSVDDVPRWRIELHDLGSLKEPLGFDILGDTVLGRHIEGADAAPDMDFSAFDSGDKGVSRRHAMLRPTRNNLYLLDLGSTNGTQRNAFPLGPGHAQAVQHDDIISLGRLTFTVKIIARPEPPSAKSR